VHEGEESPLLEEVAREWVVKTQHAGKGLVGAVVICGDSYEEFIFWDITLCNLFKVNCCLGGTCCFQARNQHEANSKHSYG
jgi:hypothetical protein